MFGIRSLVLSAVLAVVVTVPSLASAADRSVTVVNKTKSTIVAFYASRVGTNDWEEDILGTDTLAPGESVDIDIDDGTGACQFDLMAKFRDGTSATSNKVDVCQVEEFEFTE